MSKVSVIIPTYNRANLVSRAIRSVLNQIFQDLEIIAIDDGSTDNTEEVVKSFDDKRIRYIRHEKNKGGSIARNTGIKNAKGQYVAFLDDDDEWLSDKLAKQINALEQLSGEWSACYCGYFLFDSNTVRIPTVNDVIFKNLLLRLNLGSCSGLLIRKDCFDEVGLFDENLLRYQDWDVTLRISKKYKIAVVQEPLFVVHDRHLPTGKVVESAQQKFIEKFYNDIKSFGLYYQRKVMGSHWLYMADIFYREKHFLKSGNYLMKAIWNDPVQLGQLIRRFFNKVSLRQKTPTTPKVMKILFLGHISENFVSGGARQVSEGLTYLHNANVEVKFLSLPEASVGLFKKNFLLSNFWFYWHLIKMNKDNLIILEDYSLRFYFFILNWLVRMTMKVKIVGLVQAFYFNYRQSALKNYIDKIVSILFLKPLDMVFTSGQSAATELMKMGIPSSKIRNVYPALRNKFVQNNNKEQPKPCNNSTTHLLFVGRLHPTKGLEYLFEAIQLLKNEDLRLTIVGDTVHVPQYTKKMNNTIKVLGITDRISFHGQIEDLDKLIEIYKTADIFVLPSIWDTSPIAVVEAMCFGLPIVATRVGGIPEWIEDNVNGILVPPKNPQALAHAIFKLIQVPLLKENIGKKAFEKSFQFRDRTWKDVGKEYYQVLSELWRKG